MPLVLPGLSSKEIYHHPPSVGGWCLLNQGRDPFGGEVRNFSLEQVLDVLAETEIELTSWHDGDLWPITADRSQIEDTIGRVKGLLKDRRQRVLNFTTNLFSDPAFRSGAGTSPFPQVREAAVIKACLGVDAANAFEAVNMIAWDGRGGTDGCYELDSGYALEAYMRLRRLMVDYGLDRGYSVRHTEETKLYEPRHLQAYLATALHAVAAIWHYFPTPGYPRRIVTLNPEYPQHLQMLTLDPAMEVGLLLLLDMLADFIHFGGQIAGRMDSDMAPGAGGNILADFMLWLTLHRHGWKGVVEFDCRPMRTTTTLQGLKRFLLRCINYCSMLDEKLHTYLNDQQVLELEQQLYQPNSPALETALSAKRSNRGSVVAAVEALRAGFTGFDEAAKVDTDVIEAYQGRVLEILTCSSLTRPRPKGPGSRESVGNPRMG